MFDATGQSRRRIGLPALLLAWAAAGLWLGWTRTMDDLFDSMERRRIATERYQISAAMDAAILRGEKRAKAAWPSRAASAVQEAGLE
jgi:hypothetical protein